MPPPFAAFNSNLHVPPMVRQAMLRAPHRGLTSNAPSASRRPRPTLPAILVGSALAALALLVVCSWHVTSYAEACTTIIVGREATTDGSVMTTHNNDCEDCDVRIGVVPETNDNPADALCPIHPCGFEYPRYVGFDRGEMYHPASVEREGLSLTKEDQKVTEPLGHIPQVASTFRYLDGTYGMTNERSLSIGESTCGAKIVAYSKQHGGNALFDISALTRLALQRTETARDAILLMGSLAEKHGYAGSEDPFEEGNELFDSAGEALTLIDATGEAWVFHILADPTGTSAIWAAQRVPDGHLAVVPNKFIIDHMNLTDTNNFLASKDIRQKAIDAGFLRPEEDQGDEAFEFSRAFALDYTDAKSMKSAAPGEQLNSADGERRRWRVFSLIAPSAGFKPDQKERFPFSVRVEKKVDARDLHAFMRDHYEGTPFDSSIGLAAGPYGNPNRYDRNPAQQPEVANGFFERTISIHRTSYSFVAVAYSEKPLDGVMWFSHHSPQTSLYLPIFSATRLLPESFARGTLFRVSRQSAWWAFASVGNNAERMYKPIHGVIGAEQTAHESKFVEDIETIRAQTRQMVEHGRQDAALELMSQYTLQNSEAMVARWWDLLDELTATFRDGLFLKSSRPPLKQEHVFYPVEWLKLVGYFERGPLAEARYPANLPKPPQAITPPATSVAPMVYAEQFVSRSLLQRTEDDSYESESSQNDTPPTPSSSRSEGSTTITSHATLRNRDTSTGAGQHRLNEQEESSNWHRWFGTESRRWWLIALFALVFLLISCVCFRCGVWYARRNEYTPIPGDDTYPIGRVRKYPTVEAGPHVHLSDDRFSGARTHQTQV